MGAAGAGLSFFLQEKTKTIIRVIVHRIVKYTQAFLVNNQALETVGSSIFTLLTSPLTTKLPSLANLDIIIGKTVDDKIYFRVRNESGTILLTSREYSTLEKCLNEIYGVQVYTNFAYIEEKNANGHRYTLMGVWGKPVGISELYEYSADMIPHMKMLKEFIGKASVTDLSSSVRFFRKVKI